MELVITIDAEEDQWGPASSGTTSVTNIQQIPSLQKVFDEYGVVPTYLLTYPVAQDGKQQPSFRTYSMEDDAKLVCIVIPGILLPIRRSRTATTACSAIFRHPCNRRSCNACMR